MVSVLLDPGHGGSDGGASRTPFLEKTLVLDVGLKLREYLKNRYVVNVFMTRDTDRFVTLSGRTNLSNRLGVDLFVSLHFNAFNGIANGYEDFTYTASSSRSDTIRNVINSQVVQRVLRPYGIVNRGKKKANFYVLRETNSPSILIELLFCDSRVDQAFIQNEKIMNEFVSAIGDGIAIALGLPRKTKDVSSPPVVDDGNVRYRIQNGAFSDGDRAGELVTRLHAAGFDGYRFAENGLWKVHSGAYMIRENALEESRKQIARAFPSFVYADVR